jgi:hypothetical protein
MMPIVAVRPARDAHRAQRRPWGRLDFADREALRMWALAHIPLLVLAWAATWAFRSPVPFASFSGAFNHWDANLYLNIAEHGYFSGQSVKNNVAFFPGYPAALAAAHLVLRNWTVSELAVPAAAGCFAVVSLARLGGRSAVMYLLAFPAAVFLLAGYSESLFLAFAVPAWSAASRGRWHRAALLAGLAGTVRADGAFLAAALAVMALTGPRGQRLLGAVTAAAALAGPAAYEAYLWGSTGTWDAWREAMRAGWNLHMVTPLSAWKTTWHAAFGHAFAASWGGEMQMELASLLIAAAVTLAFAWRRRWPEAVYCGLAVVPLAAQTWYTTSMRTLLVLFPVYVALAGMEARRPWVRPVYLWALGPLAAVMGLLFLAYQWAG